MEASEKTQATPPFNCRRCSECCHGEGAAVLSADQVPAAAALLGLATERFKELHCRPRGDGWLIIARPDGSCSVLGPEGCLIHGAKPKVCRDWPYLRNILANESAFLVARSHCPGIDQTVSHERFVAYARAHVIKETDLP